VKTDRLSVPPEGLESFRFDLSDVILFINIAETKSFTRGAEKTQLSVPTASIRIGQLEARAGAKLFERVRREVRLTASGEAFLKHAIQIAANVRSLELHLSEHSANAQRSIRIFSHRYATSWFLPGVLERFIKIHPNVSIDLHQCVSSQVVRAVREGTAEIGLISVDRQVKGLEVLPYGCTRYVLIVPPKHPLARLRNVTFQRTFEYPYVTMSDRNDQSRAKGSIEVDGFEMIAKMVERNIGVGMVPAFLAREYQKTMNIRTVELTGMGSERTLGVCLRDRKQLSVAAQALVDLILAEGTSSHSL
jgi:DNA-binding transcriptional LysR family regulator